MEVIQNIQVVLVERVNPQREELQVEGEQDRLRVALHLSVPQQEVVIPVGQVEVLGVDPLVAQGDQV